MEREFLTFSSRQDLPFSEIVRTGDTYYIAGRIGLDVETGLPPSEPGDEVRVLMDGLRDVVERAGLTMADLVQVMIYTPDLSLYSLFNEIYTSYFSGPLPARAFLGSGPLLFGARFELTAIAVKGAA